MIAIVGFLVWLLSTYPNNPTEGAFPDGCKAIAESDQKSGHDQTISLPSNSVVSHSKTSAPHQQRQSEEEKTANERRIADYTCQLSIYTAHLATFTQWLVIATIGVAFIGLWQGNHIRRSVDVAERAFSELERAYVFPSITNIIGFSWDNGARLEFDIRMRSLGRTPAIIKEVTIKFNGTVPLVGVPDITGAKSQEHDWAITDTQMGGHFQSSYIGAQYLFGFIRYLDIFGDEHRSWIGVHFDPAEDPDSAMTRAGGDEYNSWD